MQKFQNKGEEMNTLPQALAFRCEEKLTKLTGCWKRSKEAGGRCGGCCGGSKREGQGVWCEVGRMGREG